jgi:hypothetical protein
MHPTALFPNIRNLTEIRIHPLGLNRFSKGILMHVWGATGHDHSIQTFFTNRLPDCLLSRLGAHIDVIGAMGHVLYLAYLFSNRFYVHGPGNIDPTMTDKNAQLFHDRFAI